MRISSASLLSPSAEGRDHQVWLRPRSRHSESLGGSQQQTRAHQRVAEASLKRLRIDVIDLFYQHRVDPIAAEASRGYRDGEVSAHALREASLRLLRLIDRVGAFDDPVIPPERADDRAEVRALIRRAGGGVLSCSRTWRSRSIRKSDRRSQLSGRTPDRPDHGWRQRADQSALSRDAARRITRLSPLRRVGRLRTRRRQSAHRRALRGQGGSRIFRREGIQRPRPPQYDLGEGFFMFLGHQTPGFSPMDHRRACVRLIAPRNWETISSA